MELNQNAVETIVREARKPIELTGASEFLALPEGYKLEDLEKFKNAPRRKHAKVSMDDTNSFVDYVKRHGSLANATVWCDADFVGNKVAFISILNDNGEQDGEQHWRDHTAKFSPTFSEEWNRWTKMNKHQFSQAEFAAFIEENLKDIAGVEGSPTGAQMLEMALSFEANQDMRFKSAIRLQNGGVQMSFVQDDDSQTMAKMQMFDRFSLGLPVFWNGDAYRLDARLRYRVRDGKLTFWFELIRQDKVLEASTTTLIEKIKSETAKPFFFGNPFAA